MFRPEFMSSGLFYASTEYLNFVKALKMFRTNDTINAKHISQKFMACLPSK